MTSRKRPSFPDRHFLYAILDRSLVSNAEVRETAGALVESECGIIQYRGKGLPEEEAIRDISLILAAAEGTDVAVIVNDDPELAAICGADGVHLGKDDPDPGVARDIMGPGKIIGVTIHTMEELFETDLGAADYVAVGAIFASPTKGTVDVVGTGFIGEVKAETDLPIVAIGGITPGNADEAFEAGARGIAVISSLLEGDVRKNCFTFNRIIDKRLMGGRRQPGSAR